MGVGYATVVLVENGYRLRQVFVFIGKKTTERIFKFLFIIALGLVLWLPQASALHSYHGVITSSFRASAKQAGVASELVDAFMGIFEPQLDFKRELRRGDRWRFIIRNRQAGIGAAEYLPRRGRKLQAVRYEVAGRNELYYSPDDSGSLQRAFLRSPIKGGRITSFFSRRGRFHPLLKVVRPHFGVDYSARAGTQVMSVANGVVVRATYNRVNGWYVKLLHYPFYHTAYCHLQKIATGLKRGSTVKQGDVIGYVGASGRATGPHLHFSFYERGRYADPLRKQFPPKTSVPQPYRADFQQRARNWLAQLPPYPAGT